MSRCKRSREISDLLDSLVCVENTTLKGFRRLEKVDEIKRERKDRDRDREGKYGRATSFVHDRSFFEFCLLFPSPFSIPYTNILCIHIHIYIYIYIAL